METTCRGLNEATIILTHRELFDIICSSPQKKVESKFTELESKIVELTGYKQLPVSIKRNISKFKSDFKKKWNLVCRKSDKFLIKYSKWLNQKVKFSKWNATLPMNKGRPSSKFIESSERTKRFKTVELRKNVDPQKLIYAAQMNLRAQGYINASKIVKDISCRPSVADDYCQALKKQKTVCSKLSADEALSLVIEAKLSKSQYNLIRFQAKQKNCHIYPSYDEVLEAKKRCYPTDISIISDTEAEISLQSLLHHTTDRLIHLQKEVLQQSLNNVKGSDISLILVCKWGFDGSSGQSEYKQRFQNPNDSDSSIFLTTLVPIKLILKQTGKTDIIIWHNSRTSSPRFCRPIKLQYIHESSDLIVTEKYNMDNQINQLQSFTCTFNQKNITVSFELHFTMIDGKVCNAIAENRSTQKCYICGATSKEFNKIDSMISRPIIDDNLKFGLSTLHAWIRFFECLLHLAYKMDLKKWQARGLEDKLKVTESKKRIKEELRSEIGLIVDKPKPGFGNSNDGNTARRFFENAEIVANITKIDINILKRFHVILQTLSSGFDIDVKKFKSYALDTAKLFVSLYPWYYMPTTIHKILVHGSQIINSFLLPIGMLSEEAQEARNKDIKQYREHFSRKTSRKDHLVDVINRLLVSSDPLISNLRKLPKKKIKFFFPETINLLKPPKFDDHISVYESSSEED